MGLIANNNVPGINFPCWEQMPAFMPANSAAGSCMCSDNKRYIYYLISTSSFWKIDTWTGACEQLSNPGSGGVGAGTCMCYVPEAGSIFVLLASGTTIVFYMYSIEFNNWSQLDSTGLPANFGVAGCLFYPSSYYFNGDLSKFHSESVIKVKLLQEVTPSDNIENILIETQVGKVPYGSTLNFGDVNNPKYLYIVSGIEEGNTSISISSTKSTIEANSIAYYYDHIYLIGNNSTQMYRYSMTNNNWSTVLPNNNTVVLSLAWSAGAGCFMTLFKMKHLDIVGLLVIQGANTRNYCIINMNDTTKEYYATVGTSESPAVGSQYAVKIKDNKPYDIISCINNTRKYNYLNITGTQIKNPISYQDLVSEGTAIAGNRTCILNQNGIDYLYTVLNTSNYMLRCPILW